VGILNRTSAYHNERSDIRTAILDSLDVNVGSKIKGASHIPGFFFSKSYYTLVYAVFQHKMQIFQQTFPLFDSENILHGLRHILCIHYAVMKNRCGTDIVDSFRHCYARELLQGVCKSEVIQILMSL